MCSGIKFTYSRSASAFSPYQQVPPRDFLQGVEVQNCSPGSLPSAAVKRRKTLFSRDGLISSKHVNFDKTHDLWLCRICRWGILLPAGAGFGGLLRAHITLSALSSVAHTGVQILNDKGGGLRCRRSSDGNWTWLKALENWAPTFQQRDGMSGIWHSSFPFENCTLHAIIFHCTSGRMGERCFPQLVVLSPNKVVIPASLNFNVLCQN